MATCRVWAAGPDPAFREEVADALGMDLGKVGWVHTMPALEESMMRVGDPPDLVVVSPQVHPANAAPAMEFIGREYPSTTVVMLRDRSRRQGQPRA
jgi:hypothetical protein